VRISSFKAALLVLSLLSAVPPSPAGDVKPPSKAALKSLHRVDFRVEGATCVVCIRRVAKALQDQKGVLKADVSIYKPHWALVIYNSKETNFDKLADLVKVKENVRIVDIEDKAISSMPVLILPRTVNTISEKSGK
jgi:copper chaperone CopZ